MSPNNPTGSVIQEDTLLGIIKLAEKYNIPIISDEVFSEFIFAKKSFPRLATISNTHKIQASNVTIFTLQGISKTYALPGLKLSWIIVSGKHQEEYLSQLERFADTLLATNQITQTILPELIKHGEKYIVIAKNHLENNRRLATAIFKKCPSLSFIKPQGGFYLFAKINHLKMDDEKFVIAFMKHAKIFVHPGYFYDYDDGVYILISLLLPHAQFKSCLQKLIKFINALTKF